jgi:photosystem II stability/assembly factor-like uncharacterized protein
VATVFISYRRADTQQACGRIRERLVEQYGSEAVFLDIEKIGYGQRFLDEITRAISQCDVFLLLMGSRWVDQQNKARLFETTDVVRLEIETALRLGVTIVPVLIDRALFPTQGQLPDTLHPILGINAASIDSGLDFDVYVQRLIEQIDSISSIAVECRQALRLSHEKWHLSDAPTKDAVIALDSHTTDAKQIYAIGLSSNRVLQSLNAGGRWISFAKLPTGMRAKCFAVDLRKKGTLWVGMTGHLFQMNAARSEWAETKYFANLGERSVRSIAVNPTNPAHVLIGTGVYSAGVSVGASTISALSADREVDTLGESNWREDLGCGDLHVTRDGGTSWRSGPFKNVNRVLLAETDPSVVYVATSDNGLFVSTNGGASFRRSPGSEAHTLWSATGSPHDSKTIILGTNHHGALISRDCGQTWTSPHEIGEVSVLCAAFSTGDPTTLIIGTEAGTFISEDGGQAFRLSNRGLVHRRVLSAASSSSKGFVIGTDGGGIYTRASGSNSWSQTYSGLTRRGVGALCFDNTDVLYMGAEGLLCRTDDFGKSFQPIHHVLSPIRAISVFMTSKAPRSAELVVSWNQNDTYLIGTDDGEIHRSGDFGESWECVLKCDCASIRKIGNWAASSEVVHAVAQTRALYKSEDCGRTWRKLGGSNLNPTTFAVLPHDHRCILMGTFEDGVMFSEDAGTTWRPVGVGLPKKPVACLELPSSSSGGRLLVGLQEGGFWRCDQGWDQWVLSEGVAADESINDMEVRGEHILLATNAGVLISADAGANWLNYSEGLSNIVQVTRVVLSSDGQTLFCGEVGGLYGRLAKWA